MRKLILILFILLSCASLANAGGIISFPGGGVPSAAVSYDLEESFESSGDAYAEYDNVECGVAPCVTETAGDPTGDQLNSGLDAGIDMEDTYCLALDHTETFIFDAGTVAQGTSMWVLGKFAHNDTLEDSEGIVSMGSNIYFFLFTDDKLRAFAPEASGYTAAAVPADADVWLKFEGQEGTGANARACVAYWTGAAWSDWTCKTNGTCTTEITDFKVYNTQDAEGEDMFWDNIKIKIGGEDPFAADPSTY